MSKVKPRTVIRIDSGVFILRLHPDRVETCNHVRDAMNVSGWSLATLQNVLNSLYHLGYKNMRVMVIKDGESYIV